MNPLYKKLYEAIKDNKDLDHKENNFRADLEKLRKENRWSAIRSLNRQAGLKLRVRSSNREKLRQSEAQKQKVDLIRPLLKSGRMHYQSI